MSRVQLKLAALSALRENPDFSNLDCLRSCNDRGMRYLLRWLDESGLALHFLARLRDSGEMHRIPAHFRLQLERRLESNRKRADAMLAEFGRISASLGERGIPHAFLKGFALVPDFCPAIELRHQSDIDILISAESAAEARSAIFDCGYSIEQASHAGELHFSTPRKSPPSLDDDIYTANYHREVELHTSLWKDIDHVSLNVATDCLNRIRFAEIKGIRFASLSLEDMFVGQVLHAFQHLLGSWIRVAWLWEIHCFMVNRSGDAVVWRAVIARCCDSPALRNAFGLILLLTNRLFASPIPQVLGEWCVETLPGQLSEWVSEFGFRWALSDLSGSKLSLLVHKEFIEDSAAWRSYLWRRLIPLEGRPTLGPVKSAGTRTAITARTEQFLFRCRRALFHATSSVSFSFDRLRWHRLLHSGLKQRAVSGWKRADEGRRREILQR